MSVPSMTPEEIAWETFRAKMLDRHSLCDPVEVERRAALMWAQGVREPPEVVPEPYMDHIRQRADGTLEAVRISARGEEIIHP